MDWMRTCQECGHQQKTKKPAEPITDSYRNSVCCKCKSPALDYGKEVKNSGVPHGEVSDEEEDASGTENE
jgi:hypothetical protein